MIFVFLIKCLTKKNNTEKERKSANKETKSGRWNKTPMRRIFFFFFFLREKKDDTRPKYGIEKLSRSVVPTVCKQVLAKVG